MFTIGVVRKSYVVIWSRRKAIGDSAETAAAGRPCSRRAARPGLPFGPPPGGSIVAAGSAAIDRREAATLGHEQPSLRRPRRPRRRLRRGSGGRPLPSGAHLQRRRARVGHAGHLRGAAVAPGKVPARLLRAPAGRGLSARLRGGRASAISGAGCWRTGCAPTWALADATEDFWVVALFAAAADNADDNADRQRRRRRRRGLRRAAGCGGRRALRRRHDHARSQAWGARAQGGPAPRRGSIVPGAGGLRPRQRPPTTSATASPSARPTAAATWRSARRP